MSKTRPSSSSMGATPPQRRAERVEHSQQHVRRGAEQPRGGARNAWGRKGERDGGRRSRGDEEENFFKSRPGSQKSRFSLPLQPESNCTILILFIRIKSGWELWHSGPSRESFTFLLFRYRPGCYCATVQLSCTRVQSP